MLRDGVPGFGIGGTLSLRFRFHVTDHFAMLALLRRWFGFSAAGMDEKARLFRNEHTGHIDTKMIWVLLTTAVALTIQQYAGHPVYVQPVAGFLANILGGPAFKSEIRNVLDRWGGDQLSVLLWWFGVAVACYVVIPIAVIKGVFRERLSDYGLKLRGFTAGWPIYLIFVAGMIPLVTIFSAESHFQATYPFYRIASRAELDADFLKWEIAYALQFVALEFFFRGFLLHGIKHRLGFDAVFVMTVPYCMIHFQKPLPECFASIVAGVLLGFMSLKTRSIWLGAALHISVAWGMDFASLYRKGLIG
jgi:membrane protease YdiL (CAAX protease family)